MRFNMILAYEGSKPVRLFECQVVISDSVPVSLNKDYQGGYQYQGL